MFRVIVLVIFAALLTPAMSVAQTAAATDAIGKIRDEGMNRSKAMETIRYLTDVIGPRLTNSPGQKRREISGPKQQLEKWGLKNAMRRSVGRIWTRLGVKTILGDGHGRRADTSRFALILKPGRLRRMDRSPPMLFSSMRRTRPVSRSTKAN